jgi:hypothetical protein
MSKTIKSPRILIKGTSKSGYILTIFNPQDKFKADIALLKEELDLLYQTLKKYYATRA